MLLASKIMSIGIIVLSTVAGFISFYILSDSPKQQKKKQLEELTSQLINFVIFCWIGKIILNLSVFIEDPLAIVAYPSNSEAFYLAVLFIGIVLVYKSIRNKIDLLAFTESFLMVFLTGSFLYEFIQLVWGGNTYSFGYLVLLTILLVTFFLIRERVTSATLTVVMIVGWSVGMFVLPIFQTFVTVFGYIIVPWFVGLFFVTSMSIIIYEQRKRD